jgi:uncharacterized protein YkwD
MRDVKVALLLAGFAAALGCGGGGHHGGYSGTSPTGTGPTTSTTTGALTADPHYQAALSLLNQSRSQHGSPPVVLDELLCECALRHAQDLAACSNNSISGFSGCAHKDFNSGDRCGAGSENQGIATGITSASEDSGFATIHNGMMSEGPPPQGQINHYSNIIDPTRTAVGVGLYIDPNGNLWVSEEFK